MWHLELYENFAKNTTSPFTFTFKIMFYCKINLYVLKIICMNLDFEDRKKIPKKSSLGHLNEYVYSSFFFFFIWSNCTLHIMTYYMKKITPWLI